MWEVFYWRTGYVIATFDNAIDAEACAIHNGADYDYDNALVPMHNV